MKLWKLPNTIHSSPKLHLIHAMPPGLAAAHSSAFSSSIASTSYLREYSQSREALFPLLGTNKGKGPLTRIFRVLHVSVLPLSPSPLHLASIVNWGTGVIGHQKGNAGLMIRSMESKRGLFVHNGRGLFRSPSLCSSTLEFSSL